MENILNDFEFDYGNGIRIKRFFVPVNEKVKEAVGKVSTDAFGENEWLYDIPTVSGEENEYNYDVQYLAMDDDTVLGIAHITISRLNPLLAGISNLATTPQARGKGIGSLLFKQCVNDIDKSGAEVAFLATSNPIAAKLYQSVGFRYLPGANAMVRVKDNKSYLDFISKYFSLQNEKLHIMPATPAFRYALPPLVMYRDNNLVLDCNANLWDCGIITQQSCAGLYGRYLEIIKNGGNVAGLVSDDGVLFAIASVLPTEHGKRFDFYAHPNCKDSLPVLIKWCEEQGAEYALISEGDCKKQNILINLGYSKTDEQRILNGFLSVNANVMCNKKRA